MPSDKRLSPNTGMPFRYASYSARIAEPPEADPASGTTGEYRRQVLADVMKFCNCIQFMLVKARLKAALRRFFLFHSNPRVQRISLSSLGMPR